MDDDSSSTSLIVESTVEKLLKRLIDILDEEKEKKIKEIEYRHNESLRAINNENNDEKDEKNEEYDKHITVINTTKLLHTPFPFRIVVAAVDGSECTRDSIDWARQNGYILPSDFVVLLTVWEEHIETRMSNDNTSLNKLSNNEKSSKNISNIYTNLLSLRHDSIRKNNENALENACKTMKDFFNIYLSDCNVFPFVVSSSDMGKKSVGSIICHTAEAINAHIIIVGTHGYGKFKTYILGSVSKHVMDNAKLPVLLVKNV